MTNFLLLRFYVKPNLGDLKLSKMLFLAILGARKFNFNEFLQFLRAEIYQNQKFKASKIAKTADFELLDFPNLISRKI